jgi:prohibitin 1
MSERSVIKRIVNAVSILLSTTVLISSFLVVALWPMVVKTTPVGHSSVVWRLMSWTGNAKSIGPIPEGITVIFPWDKFYTYDVRLKTLENQYSVVSADGLHFTIDMSIRWTVIRENIVDLNQDIGPDYVDTLLVPQIGSVLREVIVGYNAADLYATDRIEIQRVIFEKVARDSIETGITEHYRDVENSVVSLQDILILNIELPAAIKEAIERKLTQGQLVEEYRLRIERERLEAERKRVEAAGIRDFQAIITPGISDSYLRWLGIEATLNLAQSENAKIVVIGNDSSAGLPLIMDTRVDPDTSVVPTEGAPALEDIIPNGVQPTPNAN